MILKIASVKLFRFLLGAGNTIVDPKDELSELELRISRGVIQEFQSQHILPSIKAKVDDLIKLKTREIVGEKDYWRTIKLSKEYREEITDIAEKIVKSEINETVHASVEKSISEIDIQAKIDYWIHQYIHDMTFTETAKQVKASVTDALSKT